MRRNQQHTAGEGSGLVARLLECHVRIREMLAMGQAIEQLGSADETVAAAERLGRYFTRGLPFHTRDEDESILPRLVDPELAIALDRMHREHLEHEPLVQKVVASCRDLVDAPSRWRELRTVVAGAAGALSPIMATHLLQEERDLFPAVERLGDDVQARILEEMDARRAAGR
jgi:iron-sulfur cluster repair protein YtfE (RIC family)